MTKRTNRRRASIRRKTRRGGSWTPSEGWNAYERGVFDNIQRQSRAVASNNERFQTQIKMMEFLANSKVFLNTAQGRRLAELILEDAPVMRTRMRAIIHEDILQKFNQAFLSLRSRLNEEPVLGLPLPPTRFEPVLGLPLPPTRLNELRRRLNNLREPSPRAPGNMNAVRRRLFNTA